MKHQDMETMYGTVRHCHRSNVERDGFYGDSRGDESHGRR